MTFLILSCRVQASFDAFRDKTDLRASCKTSVFCLLTMNISTLVKEGFHRQNNPTNHKIDGIDLKNNWDVINEKQFQEGSDQYQSDFKVSWKSNKPLLRNGVDNICKKQIIILRKKIPKKNNKAIRWKRTTLILQCKVYIKRYLVFWH